MEDREERTTYVTNDTLNYKCEKCGFEIALEGMIIDWHYCPKCGAVIDSWQEE